MTAPVFAQSTPVCGPLDDGRVANVFYEGTAVFFEPIVEYEYDLAVLTISGPCEDIVRTFKRGEQISFDIREIERVTDGHYTWQLRIEPTVDPGVQKELHASRGTGEEDEVWWSYWQKGAIPVGPRVDSASFTVFRGGIIDPDSGEEKRASVGAKGRASSVAAVAAGAVGEESTAAAEGGGAVLGAKDQVIPDDLIVQGSLCVGFDCVNGEVFSFDTIRLKENNLRIKFEDTSGGSFPTRDWEIEANSSANGGQTHLRFNDVDAGRSPFTVEGNSPSHSLYVDSTGRVGFGTSTPILELHVANGDTPALRLDQNTSSGFAAQVWDVAGNETNFFVRDATNGSTLPFRIFPGASSSSLVIDDTDNVGLGTTSPDVDFHILAPNEAAADVQFKIEANTDPAFDFEEQDSGVTWRFINNNAVLKIADVGTGSDPAEELVLTQAGDLTITGEIFTSGSCVGGCDVVFNPDYRLPSIEEHAFLMRQNRHLPAVGPTPENGPFNLSQMTGGMLNELEKAHLYIAQLHDRLTGQERENADLAERLRTLETLLLQGAEK